MVFGFINYLLVTKPYYDSHVGSITVPELKTVVITELIRSVLIILSILPLIISLKAVGRKQIIACGLVLFVIGGIIPLLLQLGTLPLSLLAASGIEIFFQNFLTGAVAALLLGYPRSSVQNPMNRWKRYI
jgi:hypothetical protein